MTILAMGYNEAKLRVLPEIMLFTDPDQMKSLGYRNGTEITIRHLSFQKLFYGATLTHKSQTAEENVDFASSKVGDEPHDPVCVG